MAYSLATATTEVRALINEATADYWSDSEIQEWLKQGTISIATKLLSAESEDTVTLDGTTPKWVYSSSEEAWLANLLMIKTAYYTDASGNVYGMQRIKPEQFGHTQEFQTAGRPKYFYESNHKLYVWPKPSATENGQTITILNSYETDDITNLRDEHQPIAFLYAAAKAKLKELQFQDAALFMAEFTNSVNFERGDKYDMGEDTEQDFQVK